MPLRVLGGIAKGFAAIVRGAGRGFTAGARAVAARIAPAIKSALRAAKNIGSQALSVLKRKANVASNVTNRAKSFWNWAKNRAKSASQRLTTLRRKKQTAQTIAAERDVAAEERDATQELAAIQRIEADEHRIGQIANREREHDVPLLTAQANHWLQMAMVEAERGRIDPQALERAAALERALLQRLEQAEGTSRQAVRDEFAAMQRLRSDLERERQQLEDERRHERTIGDWQDALAARSREAQVASEENMLLGVEHLAVEEEQIDEKALRKLAQQLYALIQYLIKIAQEEAHLRGIGAPSNYGYQPPPMPVYRAPPAPR